MYQRKHDGSVQHSNTDPVWPVLASSSLSEKRLKVLILGHSRLQDHFISILATNVRQWGYEATIISTHAGTGEDTHTSEIEGDILVYDLDTPSHMSGLPASKTDESTAYLTNADKSWPHVRLIIVLSNHSISRLTLEQIGAVALIHKPFQIEQLQRYLRVFQHVLHDEGEHGGDEAIPQLPVSTMMVGEETRACAERSARILVVEDHPRVAETIRQCLEFETGYDIRIAEDGLEALEQCVAWHPHCIVTDLILPYMDGYQIMRTLATTTSGQLPAFVVISALTQHEMPENHVYPHGKSVIFIDKPFQIENLLDAVEQALAS